MKRRADSCGDRYLKRTHTHVRVTRGKMKRIRKELSEELLFGLRIDKKRVAKKKKNGWMTIFTYGLSVIYT